MRRIIVGLLAVGLLASGCSSGVSGPQTYAVDADLASPGTEALQVSAYFPGTVKAAAGDEIEFTNKSTEAPHTVTLGVKADRTNQPAILDAKGAESPVAFGPCFSEEDPTPQLAACPTTELPEFAGTGYWNSGVLSPAPAPEAAGPKTVTVKLADDIVAGEYAFVCVLHPFMNGTLEVGEEDERITPEEVTEAASNDSEEALVEAQDIEAPELETEGNTVTAAAGWGDNITSVNLFPSEIAVKKGQTVRWTARSPYEPHTVTFESPYKAPADPASFAPGGVKSGSDYTGGFSNSGLFGAEGTPFAPPAPFELKFTKAGEYSYLCTLHANMKGVVKVT